MACEFVPYFFLFSGAFYLRSSLKQVIIAAGSVCNAFSSPQFLSFKSFLLGCLYPNFTGLKLFSRP